MTTESSLRKPGDRIVIESRRAGGHAREGVVAEVLGPPGHEHYLVRWDDGEQSLYYPQHHPEATAPESTAESDSPTAHEQPEKPRLHAEVGDRLVIHGHHQGEPERDAEILETRGLDGSPPFLVRWSDTGHEAIFYPASDAAVEHIVKRKGNDRSTADQ